MSSFSTAATNLPDISGLVLYNGTLFVSSTQNNGNGLSHRPRRQPSDTAGFHLQLYNLQPGRLAVDT
jgi:hypothetical protein